MSVTALEFTSGYLTPDLCRAKKALFVALTRLLMCYFPLRSPKSVPEYLRVSTILRGTSWIFHVGIMVNGFPPITMQVVLLGLKRSPCSQMYSVSMFISFWSPVTVVLQRSILNLKAANKL